MKNKAVVKVMPTQEGEIAGHVREMLRLLGECTSHR